MPDTLATVLQRQPAWRDMPETMPRQVTNLLRKCLEKIPADRWAGFAEVFEELTRPVTSSSVPARGSGAKIGGLVVLPLRNLSGDPDQEFFAAPASVTGVGEMSCDCNRTDPIRTTSIVENTNNVRAARRVSDTWLFALSSTERIRFSMFVLRTMPTAAAND